MKYRLEQRNGSLITRVGGQVIALNHGLSIVRFHLNNQSLVFTNVAYHCDIIQGLLSFKLLGSGRNRLIIICYFTAKG